MTKLFDRAFFMYHDLDQSEGSENSEILSPDLDRTGPGPGGTESGQSAGIRTRTLPALTRTHWHTRPGLEPGREPNPVQTRTRPVTDPDQTGQDLVWTQNRFQHVAVQILAVPVPGLDRTLARTLTR